MATFHDRTAAPICQRGLLRAAGRPCAVLTTAEVVDLVAEVTPEPLLPAMTPRRGASLAHQADTLLLSRPAPLPSLTAALSRRRAVFGTHDGVDA